jgi:hypothetical protein
MELGRWLKKANDEYRARKREAERRVVRWEWYTSHSRHIEPFYFERNKFARGKSLKAPRTPKDGEVAYGLDESGQVLVERQYVSILRDGVRWCYETFHRPGKQTLEWVRYSYAPDKGATAVHRATYDRQRIVTLEMRGRYGGHRERYRYQGENIVKIDREVEQQDGRGWTDWFEVKHDSLGRVSEILGWDPYRKRKSIVFARPQDGEKLNDLAEAVEARLVTLIPRAIAKCKWKEPAFSLVVAYDGEGNDMLPPAVGVGLTSERAMWNGSKDMWNPAEYRNYPLLLPTDEKLSVLCRKLNQQIAMKGQWSKGRKLLERVSAALRKKSWKNVLPTTDDFAVYAVDYECGNLSQALKQAGVKRGKKRAASRRPRNSRP